MHHKRRRPKHQRMACFCKNHKDEREGGGVAVEKASIRRQLQDGGDEVPAGYIEALGAAMSTWLPLVEEDGEDPPLPY